MKIAVIILCRFNSTRLPGKILKTIKNKAILEHIINRVSKVFPHENIIVATSIDDTDQPIVDFCIAQGYNLYRGDLNNVAERFLQAAHSIQATYAIRINGDNLFVDIPLLESFKKLISSTTYDFVSNVKDRTYPKGMSIEAVNVEFYQRQLASFKNKSDYEHVTSYLYDHPPDNAYYFYNTTVPEAAGIQLAIDTPQDFEIASRIINEMEKDPEAYSLNDIYKYYIKQKN